MRSMLHQRRVWLQEVSGTAAPQQARVGYDGTLNIEHEDTLVNSVEGVRRPADLLKQVVLVDAADWGSPPLADDLGRLASAAGTAAPPRCSW